MTRLRVAYGPAPEQFCDLSVPAGDDMPRPARRPVVVLVHGGFWRARYGLDLMEPLVTDAVANGWAAWNIEYRRVGQPGGGHPGTLADVGAAIDRLAPEATAHGLDLDRVAVVGHSAGGHLALWAAGRHLLPAGAPGAEPSVRPVLAVGLAAVCDLVGAARERLGDGATQAFMGGEPDDIPEAYTLAQPSVGAVETVLVHGDRDATVPPAQSLRYGDAATVVEVQGDDHMDVIDPASASWAAARRAIRRALAPGGPAGLGGGEEPEAGDDLTNRSG